MSATDYDVIIVGARCAGATLACFLARQGARVLCVDAASLGTDQILSTHTIHPSGMDILDDIGVGDAVRHGCPPSYRLRLRQDNAVVDLSYPDGYAEYCPRRDRLDSLLQQAAIDAGAELHGHCKVTGLVHAGNRVGGVRLRRMACDTTVHAPLVVGADGRYSTVARLLEADEYLGYDAPRGAYWAYWDAPATWHTDSAYSEFDFYAGQTGTDFRLIFQTDHNQLLIASAPRLTSRTHGARTTATASSPISGPTRSSPPSLHTLSRTETSVVSSRAATSSVVPPAPDGSSSATPAITRTPRSATASPMPCARPNGSPQPLPKAAILRLSAIGAGATSSTCPCSTLARTRAAPSQSTISTACSSTTPPSPRSSWCSSRSPPSTAPSPLTTSSPR